MVHKSIVFDLDHTIGYFKQFIYILNHIMIDKENDSYQELFDLFPEVFRPNIFVLFEYLLKKRRDKRIKSIFLYTNNNNDVFVNKIVSYIHYKLKETLFDGVITPMHPLRTERVKSYEDLIKCSSLNSETKICFIDDKKHLNMKHDNIFYVQCEPYVYEIKQNEIYKRLNVHIPDYTSHHCILNSNNQKRVTEQIWNRIHIFISRN
jgi:hypothetical protein